MSSSPWWRRLLWAAVALTLCVVVLGAYVRLSDAGLGCPDWPGCYGHLTWPQNANDIAQANLNFPQRAVEGHKAGKEMLHRFFAGTLGVLVLLLAWVATTAAPRARATVIAAALLAIAAIALNHQGLASLALFAAALALLLPFLGAVTWRATTTQRFVLASLGLIIFQAMLGMWTVTLKLKPIVVTAHLLGGLATGSLLLWAALHLDGRPRSNGVPRALGLSVLALLGMQIFLGGWTSTNYAALSCPDFPTCLGQWLPKDGFREGFVLFREIGVNYEGGILDGAARAAIHWTHRLGAMLVAIGVLTLSLRLLRADGDRRLAAVLLVLLATQISLGIANVLLHLPLAVATAHNAVAALLLASVLVALSRARGAPALANPGSLSR